MRTSRPGDEPSLAAVVDGAAVGGIGLAPGEDIRRDSAEIGYWLGVEYPSASRPTRAAG